MTKQGIKDLLAGMDSASRLLGDNSLAARVTKLSLAVDSDEDFDYEELAALRITLVGELFTQRCGIDKLLNKLTN